MAGKLGILIALMVLFVPAGHASYCVPPKPPAKPAPPDEPCPACEPKECKKCTASPVYLGLGTYVRDEMDLTLRTPGAALAVSRYYDSGRAVDGPMGIGWTSSLTSRIYDAVYAKSATDYLHKAYVVMPHGALYEFTRQSNGSYTPPIGRRDVLVRNGDSTYDLTVGNSRNVLHFNADGTLSWTKDQFNNAINYTYDGNGRVQRVADGAGSGRYVDVTWNTAGRISSVADSAGRTVRYTYDAAGNLERVADAATPVGSYSKRYYYAAGRFKPLLSRVEDRWDRLISRIEWDSAEKVVSYTEGDYNDASPAASAGEKYRYEYWPLGGPYGPMPHTRRIHSLGGKKYDYVAGTGLRLNTNVDYDGAGQVTSKYDDDGRRTAFTYDATGRVLTEIVYDAYGQQLVKWTYTYDAAFPDKVLTKKPNNATLWAGTRFEYYPPGSLAPGALKAVYKIRTDGITEDWQGTYVYNGKGQLTSSTGVPDTPQTIYTYNAAGDLIQVKRATLSVFYEYDALGRVTKSTDEMGKATTYTYDAVDRLLTATLPKPTAASPLNFTTTFTYDQYDPLTGLAFVLTTDANSRVSKRGYDALENLVKVIDPLQNATTYAYQYNLLSSVADANGNTTTYAYDANRQLESTTYPDGGVEHYTRSENGRLNTVTDRRGNKLTYSYDEFGRIVGKSYYDYIWPSGGYKQLRYYYTGQKLTTVGDQLVEPPRMYNLAYDAQFRVITEGYLGEVQTEYAYENNNGRMLKSYTIRPPFGNNDRVSTVYYTYDSMARVHTIGFSQALTDAVISYNGRGQYQQIEFGNGILRDYTYDGQGRLTGVSTTHPTAGTIASYTYGYDYDYATSTYTMLGQRSSVTPMGQSTPTKYRYDAAYQLIESLSPGEGYTRWEYDAIGNRTAQIGQYSGTTAYEYYKNGTNPSNSPRLKKVGTGPVLTYDANGNQLYVATWDYDNRLLQYSTTTFDYDYRSRRIKRLNARYSYVGQNVARIRDTTASVLDDYLFGPGIDEPLVRKNASGGKAYYVTDGLGSVVGVADDAGVISEGRAFDAWGRTTTALNFGYTGREPGAITLLYYRARYYESSNGRFISEDPLQRATLDAYSGGFARQPRHVPEYMYARNSPVSFTDPLGLDPGQSGGGVQCVSDCIDSYTVDIYKCLKYHTYAQLGCIAGFVACEAATLGTGSPLCLYGLAICEAAATLQWFDCKSDANMAYGKCLKGCCP